MNIVLYYAPYTCAMAPFITLTEAGANFEIRPLDFRREQNHSPEYLKINPKHKVPLLVAEDGRTLTENAAIQMWISRRFPEARLLPADPWEELQAVSLMSWCSSGIHPYLRRINNTAKVCDAPGSADSVIALARKELAECFEIGDGLLAGREYFFDHFTAPDSHYFWCCRRATQFDIDLGKYPATAAHFERMLGRDSVKKLLAVEKETIEEFGWAA